jgi:hypothetical protein
MNHLGLIVLGLGVLAWLVRQTASARARHQPQEKRPVIKAKAVSGSSAGVPAAGALLEELRMAAEPLTRHQLFTQVLETAYRHRQTEASRRLLLDQGARYLAEFESLMPAVVAEMGPQPVILPLKWMVITLEEDGRHEEADAICRKAEDWKLSDGTKTGFAGRRLRMDRKRQHSARPAEST